MKTTADIFNRMNVKGLDFTARYILKTMLDMSWKNRLIPRKQVYEVVKVSPYILAAHILELRKKGFLERHLIETQIGTPYSGYVHYEVVAFSERVPCK